MGATDPAFDLRDLRPKGRSGDDRRQGPRREGERVLHYAEQILLSEACAYVDMLLDQDVPDDDDRLLEKVVALTNAVESFREAADKINRGE